MSQISCRHAAFQPTPEATAAAARQQSTQMNLQDILALVTPENATNAATIAGLIAAYSSEHKSSTTPEFVGWLREQHREDIAKVIESNEEVSNQVRALLQINHAELLSKLRAIGKQLDTLIASSVSFGRLAQALNPHRSSLSKQALSALMQLSAEGAYLLEHKAMSRPNDPRYLMVSGGAEFQFTEPRHLQEDLDSLVIAGLAHKGFNSKGARTYAITRYGEVLALAMKASPEDD